MIRNSIICIVIFLYASCTLPDKGIIDPSISPPFLSQATLTPTLIEVNRISVTLNPNDPVDTFLVLTAAVQQPEGSEEVASVNYSLINPEGTTLITDQILSDNGTYPDLSAGDGIFSGLVHLQVFKKDVGNYILQIQATNKEGDQSNLINITLRLQNYSNHNPVLSNLEMPDTIFVPSEGTGIIKLSITASDSDGLQDIAKVTVNLSNESGVIVDTYQLYDDGGTSITNPLWGVTSGDSVAGDGIYCLQIPVPSNTIRSGYRDFTFIAADRSAATSEPITKRVYFK